MIHLFFSFLFYIFLSFARQLIRLENVLAQQSVKIKIVGVTELVDASEVLLKVIVKA